MGSSRNKNTVQIEQSHWLKIKGRQSKEDSDALMDITFHGIGLRKEHYNCKKVSLSKRHLFHHVFGTKVGKRKVH
jgi:hypothetical protein